MTTEAIKKLHTAVRDAVEYVGAANYREREMWALQEVSRCFNAAIKDNLPEIVFNPILAS